MNSQLDLDYNPVRKDAPETSVDAFAHLKRFKLADQVLYHLYIKGAYGATNSELVSIIKRNPNSIQPRTADLSRSSKQYIMQHPEGIKRFNKYKNKEIVWVITPAGAAYLKTKSDLRT